MNRSYTKAWNILYSYIIRMVVVNSEQIRFQKRTSIRRRASKPSAHPYMPGGKLTDGDAI